ncbi:hypothetical protein AURDEDRAFT_78909 [Auricularia subglabra TFB-10046 SS5]|nr:hypothetical protein AURDEDRAFT_78909 [Auricularia subglabra TFB-10046 SS5]
MAPSADAISERVVDEALPRRVKDGSTASGTSDDVQSTKRIRFRGDDLVIELDTSSKASDARRGLKIPSSVWARLSTSWLVRWIPPRWNWASAKPVIRSSVTAWVSLMLLLHPRTERALGQHSFMLAAFLSPTNMPFAGVFEKEALNVTLVLLATAWSALAIKVSMYVRKEVIPYADLEVIITGRYLEVLPTVICGIFLFFGTAFYGYLKSRFGPGPYTIATIFAHVCIIRLSVPADSLRSFQLSRIILIPAATHAGVSLLCSLIVFPQSINAQFIKCLAASLTPLESAIRTQPRILSLSPYSEEFKLDDFRAHLHTAEASIIPLAASARLMRRDLSYGRFNGEDLKHIHVIARQLLIRGEGMSFFFKLLDPLREKFPETPRGSVVNSPLITPTSSRPATPLSQPSHSPFFTSPLVNVASTAPSPLATVSGPDDATPPPAPVITVVPTSSSVSSKHRRKGHGLHLHLPRPHFRHGLFGGDHSHENPVGIFESLKYMNLEARFEHPFRNMLLEQSMALLDESCRDLLEACADSMGVALTWLRNVNAGRLRLPQRKRMEKSRLESIAALQGSRGQLTAALESFRAEKRLIVLRPYRSHLDSAAHMPPHRFLFQTFVYQFQLTEFAAVMCQLLQDLIDLDEHRRVSRLWLPSVPWFSYARSLSNNWEVTDQTEREGEEDPDIIPGIQSGPYLDLGETHPRNPDAYPPSNIFQKFGARLSEGVDALTHGNCLFAIKAGLLTILLALPTYMQGSVRLAYVNRSVWATFIGQLNLARFRGDTAYGLVARLTATVFGGLVGVVLWYISAGSGDGNVIGMAAVCAVYFPLAFFLSIWGPLSLASNLIYHTTVALVIGISWKDGHDDIPGSPGTGFTVAWRRMLLVAIGLTAAFVFSCLPPSKSIRGYQRISHATTTLEIGAIYCCIVSLANSADPVHADASSIVTRLTALRSKLKRMHAMTANVKFEVSVYGEWPFERYNTLYHVQMEIAALLSQLLSAVQHLDHKWAHAFLKRTRFVDPEFLADVLASLTMISTALRTARPLPQLTPVLLEQFVRSQQGLQVVHATADEDFGLPRSVTMETLEDEQYMYFCVGVASANAIINRIDRLMLATKELVGEHYFIHGLELPMFQSHSAFARS